MGVYIKGLDLPESKHTVTLTICHDGYCVVEFRDTDTVPENIEAYNAVEVKTPHGRCIDLSELESIGADVHEDIICCGYVEDSVWGYSYDQIAKASTVIEEEV